MEVFIFFQKTPPLRKQFLLACTFFIATRKNYSIVRKICSIREAMLYREYTTITKSIITETSPTQHDSRGAIILQAPKPRRKHKSFIFRNVCVSSDFTIMGGREEMKRMNVSRLCGWSSGITVIGTEAN